MADPESNASYTSFLGTGWSFPPEFIMEIGELRMTSDEDDIQASLKILFGTACGERFLNPKYGIDMQELLFEPMGTTATTFLKDRIKTVILIYEPRISLLSLDIDTSALNEGRIAVIVEYEIRATNSRFNLIYPFYLTDGSEVRTAAATTA